MSPVLIVVFDGLQPAQVDPQLMPNLAGWAAEGVTFARNHPVFPTVTRANAASLVTGSYPGVHGLAANTMVFREYDPYRSIGVLQPNLAAIAESGIRILLAPTLADILSQQGQEYVAIGVGTSGNAYVHNPLAAQSGGATIHPEFALPTDLHGQLLERFGPWPEQTLPNTPRMAHAVRILTEYILPERDPAVSLIWSSEPDKSQHAAGVGSELSNQALGEADAQFRRILDWLEQDGRTGNTDLIVVSDHGYSTITGVISLEDRLREAGFPSGNQPGGVAVAPNGGSALFYAHDSDSSTCQRLAEWLMSQPWCGPMLTGQAAGSIEGALSASLSGSEGPRAPDIAMSFKWDSDPNDAGYRGQISSTGGQPGQGTHGSMSRHELRNVMFARGPSFKAGIRVETPTGNIDLAPTVLHLLGGNGPAGVAAMNGRVLHEALKSSENPEGSENLREPDWTTELHNAERRVGDLVYRQQIRLCRVGETTYLEEGSSTLGER
jgi:arylsulfatase A-like enzyme